MQEINSKIREISKIKEQLESQELKLDEMILTHFKTINDLSKDIIVNDKKVTRFVVENQVIKGKFLKKDGSESKTNVIVKVDENYKII